MEAVAACSSDFLHVEPRSAASRYLRFVPPRFAWARSLPATDFTVFGVFGLLSSLLALEASFLLVVT
jgi:hypothetical protein